METTAHRLFGIGNGWRSPTGEIDPLCLHLLADHTVANSLLDLYLHAAPCKEPLDAIVGGMEAGVPAHRAGVQRVDKMLCCTVFSNPDTAFESKDPVLHRVPWVTCWVKS